MKVIFIVVLIVMGIGYVFGDFFEWGVLVVGICLFLMFVGGCIGLIIGGIKVFCFLVFFGMVCVYLCWMVCLYWIMFEEYVGIRLILELFFFVLVFFVVYFGIVGIIIVVLLFFDFDLVIVIFVVVMFVGNVGFGLGLVIGLVGYFVLFLDGVKWLLFFVMLVGCFELFIVFVFLDFDFWFK